MILVEDQAASISPTLDADPPTNTVVFTRADLALRLFEHVDLETADQTNQIGGPQPHSP
jgi:hypothetical protein